MKIRSWIITAVIGIIGIAPAVAHEGQVGRSMGHHDYNGVGWHFHSQAEVDEWEARPSGWAEWIRRSPLHTDADAISLASWVEWVRWIGWGHFLTFVAGFFGILALVIRKKDVGWSAFFANLTGIAVGWLLIKLPYGILGIPPSFDVGLIGLARYAPVFGYVTIMWSTIALGCVIRAAFDGTRIADSMDSTCEFISEFGQKPPEPPHTVNVIILNVDAEHTEAEAEIE